MSPPNSQNNSQETHGHAQPSPQQPRPNTEQHIVSNVRKLITIGHSFALTLPAKWVRANIDPALPYVIITGPQQPYLTIHPLPPHAFTQPGFNDPYPPDRPREPT